MKMNSPRIVLKAAGVPLLAFTRFGRILHFSSDVLMPILSYAVLYGMLNLFHASSWLLPDGRRIWPYPLTPNDAQPREHLI